MSSRYIGSMPKPNNNGQCKLQKIPRLSANDLCALRDFVNKRLTEPSSLQDNNPLPLSVLIEQNPGLYRNAVDLLSAGNSVQAVAHATSIPLQTIRAMTHFIPNYRDVCRSSTSKNLALASLRMSEILVESTDRIPADRIAFTLAVATEKAELLSGGITQRTEVRPVVSREELQRLFEQLPKAKVRELPNSDFARKS
jgi:hypothetical protein